MIGVDNFSTLQGELKEFYDIHGVQLLGMGFPPKISLLKILHEKLKNQVFDAGEYFQILEDQESETYITQITSDMKEAENFKYNELSGILTTNPQLVRRLEGMLKYLKQKKKLPGYEVKLELTNTQAEYDQQGIVDPNTLELNPELETLSFYSNQIEDISLLNTQLQKLPKLKALWLNENPISSDSSKFETLRAFIEEKFPHIEILNSKFTKNASSWAFKFVTFGNDLKKSNNYPNSKIYHLSLGDRDVLHVNKLGQKLQQEFLNLRSLDVTQTQFTQLEQLDNFFIALELCKIKYLYSDLQIEHILWDLSQNGKLKGITKYLKLVNGRCLSTSNPTDELTIAIQETKKHIFKLAQCYRLLSSEQMDEQSVWYVMDELGSAIQHSDIPNVKIMPLIYLPTGKLDSAISYSIMWPTRDLTQGDHIFRDYLIGIDETKFRSCRLSVWYDIPFDIFINANSEYQLKLQEKTQLGQQLLQNFTQDPEKKTKFLEPQQGQKIKILTDNDLLINHLTLPEFEFTKELEESDILFMNTSLADDISKFFGKWINQFPNEIYIVSKDNLANTVQVGLGKVPWLQDTYNLQTQLGVFMGAYEERSKLYKDNTWIIKPPNMARSMDMVVTNSLDIIIRLLETGPKLAQKYINRPLTLRKKKIDMRWVVILRSIEPLEVFLYNIFWIRTANIDFTMDENSFTTYENHFTVMNYGHQLTQIHYNEFITEFEQENPDVKWKDIHTKIANMVREFFIAVKHVKPQMHYEKSRSVYGMDVMISLPDFQPKLLEMTFSPDCVRACKYHPHFYNDLFECLFLGKENVNCHRVI